MKSYLVKKRLSFLLYKFGLKSITEDVDKINFLLSLEILPYSKVLINKNITTINNYNILLYTDIIKEILSHNLLENKYDVYDVKLNTNNTTLGLWCSDSNNMKLDNSDEVIREFLLSCKELMKLDTELRKNINNGIHLFNLRKINQYIINVRSIIIDILNSL